ncbi:32 kda heat shock protein-related [Anaeramoeba flamelloides]|uniref:32 kDa heat shock protein-related n=1 Tax=Anaeramoeba flamelloides TaxID=1746091 RepID=A0ABQ8YFE0_9EUKA|nr:32 kda heat shock protein-related [Anaeramoeba flamelloides]
MNNSFTENPKQSVLFQNTTKGKGKQKGKDKQKGEEKQKEKEKEKEKQKKKGKCNVDDNGEPYQKCNEDQILQLTLLNKPTEFIGIQGNDHCLSNKFTNPNEFIDPNGSNDDDDDDDDDDCFDLGRSTNSLGRSSKQSMSNSNNITLQKKKQGEKEKDTKTKKNGDCFIIKKQKPKKNNDDEKVKTWMEMYSHEIEEIFQELDLDDGETNFAFNHLKIVFRYIDFNNVKKHFTRFDPIPKLIYLYTNHPHLYKIEHFFEQILYVYVYGVYEPDYHISYRIFQSLFGFDKSIMHRSVKAIQEGRPYQTRGKPKLLRTCEEEYLTERIHILAKLGISITVSECLYIANQIIHSWNLKEYHKVRKKIASTQWIYPFAKRNQLKIQRPTYLEEARLVVNESVVLNFFKLLHDLNATYKYDSHLIFNMDETSVQVKPSRKMVCLAPMNKKEEYI